MEQLQTENNAAGGLSDLTDVLGAAVSPAPTFPPVLDVCCGPKGMWFNKHDPRALYIDRRREYWKMEHPSGTRTANIDPDEIGDFTAMRFPDNTFSLVVMDPPHIPQETTTGMVVRQYGNLSGDWREMLRIGFKECFRVLKPDGVLIFKWNECRIPVKEILALSDVAPLFGHKSGKFMQTHWVTFMKTPNAELTGARRASELNAGLCGNGTEVGAGDTAKGAT